MILSKSFLGLCNVLLDWTQLNRVALEILIKIQVLPCFFFSFYLLRFISVLMMQSSCFCLAVHSILKMADGNI